MKQTVEETAKQYVANHPNSNPSIEFPEWDGVDVYDAFKAGAEWKAKQSPWISVEDRLPEINDNVLLLNKMNRSGQYFVQENSYENGEWAVKSAMFYTPIAWMPIPSFDDILKANRDVLERIKEKGDL